MDIYKNEEFEEEIVKKKKKGFFYWLINLILLCAIIALIYLVGKNIYSYMSISNATEETAVIATENFEGVTCTSETSTVEADYEEGALTGMEYNPNDVIGYIDIPSVDMYRAVTAGDSEDGLEIALEGGAAYDPSSSLPYTNGNQPTIIAGHRDKVFQPLKDVEVGDGIVLNINDQIFTYEVTDMQVIAEDAVDMVFTGEPDTLVLYTCYPFLYLAPITERYVVYAQPVESIEYDDCASTE